MKIYHLKSPQRLITQTKGGFDVSDELLIYMKITFLFNYIKP